MAAAVTGKRASVRFADEWDRAQVQAGRLLARWGEIPEPGDDWRLSAILREKEGRVFTGRAAALLIAMLNVQACYELGAGRFFELRKLLDAYAKAARRLKAVMQGGRLASALAEKRYLTLNGPSDPRASFATIAGLLQQLGESLSFDDDWQTAVAASELLSQLDPITVNAFYGPKGSGVEGNLAFAAWNVGFSARGVAEIMTPLVREGRALSDEAWNAAVERAIGPGKNQVARAREKLAEGGVSKWDRETGSVDDWEVEIASGHAEQSRQLVVRFRSSGAVQDPGGLRP